MRHTRNYRQPFDSSGTFIASKRFRCNGVPYEPGEAFDKSQVDGRRLRQMFDGRQISFADDYIEPKRVKPIQAVGPTDLLHPNRTGHKLSQKSKRALAKARKKSPGMHGTGEAPAESKKAARVKSRKVSKPRVKSKRVRERAKSTKAI